MANLQEWFDTLIVRNYGEKVAVKKVFKSYLRDSSTFKGFIKELKLHSQLEKHERIINFLGICEHPKEACFLLIIKFANSGTLRSFLAIEGTNLGWPEKLILFQQLFGSSFMGNFELLPLFANMDQLEVFTTHHEIPVTGTPIAYINLFQNC
ncbi:34652_t:CDS:2 [Gigaspora margarita]|uniref:34652_t:CDS:1 n=1 Tax=Gigaspora margarita TaxID=4874 RepID=A0ABN7VHU6_GIGMA|nr:34652_t:CDS:2 [Gigaspora margarita]